MVFVGNLPATKFAPDQVSIGALNGVQAEGDGHFVVSWAAREYEGCCTPCTYLAYKFAPWRVKWARRSAMFVLASAGLAMAAYGWKNRMQSGEAILAVLGAVGILFCYNKRGYFWAPVLLIGAAFLQYRAAMFWLEVIAEDTEEDSGEDVFEGENPMVDVQLLPFISAAGMFFLFFAVVCSCYTRCTWDKMKVRKTENQMRKILFKKETDSQASENGGPATVPRQAIMGDVDLEYAQPGARQAAAKRGPIWLPKRNHRPPVYNAPMSPDARDNYSRSGTRACSPDDSPVRAPVFSTTTPPAPLLNKHSGKESRRHKITGKRDTVEAFHAAARRGDLGLLKAMAAAKGEGEWKSKLGRGASSLIVALAAEGGHLSVMKWAREQRCDWDERVCSGAARRGHLETLQWARANGCPWDVDTCSKAAKGGHLELLKWARSNGCPWDERTTSNAARFGHLEVLAWARASGCPWDVSVCGAAVEGGHVHVLAWLGEARCEWHMAEVFRRWLAEEGSERSGASSWYSF